MHRKTDELLRWQVDLRQLEGIGNRQIPSVRTRGGKRLVSKIKKKGAGGLKKKTGIG